MSYLLFHIATIVQTQYIYIYIFAFNKKKLGYGIRKHSTIQFNMCVNICSWKLFLKSNMIIKFT